MVQKTKSIDMTKSKLILFMIIIITVGYVGGIYDRSTDAETYYVGIHTPIDESVCSYSDENVTITGCSFIDRYFEGRKENDLEIINLKDEIDYLIGINADLTFELQNYKMFFESVGVGLVAIE